MVGEELAMEPVNDFERLGSLAAEHQDARVDELANLDTARRRFLNSPLKRSIAPRATLLVAAAIAVAACMALFLMGTREPKVLTFRVGDQGRAGEVDAWLEASPERSLPISFSDGTEVRLEPSARARVTRIEATGATVRMESGRANVSVRKRKNAAWHVSLGPFRVDVTGTRFDVDWDPASDKLLLQMHEGSVVVSGCAFGSGRAVVAGETARASCRDAQLEISTQRKASRANDQERASRSGVEGNRADERHVASDVALATPDEHPASSATSASSAPAASSGAAPKKTSADWHELVRGGRHREALDAAEAAGFSAECAKASAADLVALGDAARYTGRLDRAGEAYRAVRARFPGHERAAVAAFAMGRIAFDQRADFADAARWFRTYLAEQPGGRLDRDALGRLMESLSRKGDAGGARTEAARYLERYPTGPHAEMARRLTAD
jgi:transmembrane sensor